MRTREEKKDAIIALFKEFDVSLDGYGTASQVAAKESELAEKILRIVEE